MRVASIISSISLGALLVYSMRLTLLERASRSFIDSLGGDIREKIVEASEPSKRVEKATVTVRSVEDLAKVSEETFKPIMHHDDVFYILDGDVRYEFRRDRIEEGDGAKEAPGVSKNPD
ncbi:MAG: DUF5305 family protein [Candidatus Bathyarchaeota archaeon]|nr:DUF5305 family protein [Candidatus Bathyarchaeota archaeon]